MRIYVDTTMTGPDGKPLGQLTGHIELPVLPRAGEVISLLFPAAGLLPAHIDSFSGHLCVSQVIHSPTPSGGEVQLSLEPLVLSDPTLANEVASVMDTAFGLFWQPFDEDQ